MEKPKRVLEGMPLEMDVMKKIAHQLGRLPSVEATQRVMDFMNQVVFEKKLSAIKGSVTHGPIAGQLGLLE